MPISCPVNPTLIFSPGSTWRDPHLFDSAHVSECEENRHGRWVEGQRHNRAGACQRIARLRLSAAADDAGLEK
jgi:hypothetical protein